MLTWMHTALGVALLISGVAATSHDRLEPIKVGNSASPSHWVQSSRRARWGWRGEDKDAINIDITTDGPLVECSEVLLTWASPLIPKDRALTFRVTADATWPDERGRHANLPAQDFVTPSTSHKWICDYPAGTVIEFGLSPWDLWHSSGGNVFGESANFTVQPGATKDCIPRDHIPIITTAPEQLIECEPAIFKWEGGEGPFEAFALGKLSSGDWQWDAIRNVGNDSFAWVVNYPQHTEVEINIFQTDGMTQTTLDLVVTEKGSSTSCIPKNHYPAKRPWYRHPAAITGFVFGGILVTAMVGYMGWRAWLMYQARKSGEIRLEE